MAARHRTPLITGLRSYPNPAQSVDPAVRRVLAQLALVPAARVAPRADFRAELRQQLVAIAPRVIAEATAGAPPASEASIPRVRTVIEPTPKPRRLAAPLLVLVGAAAMCILLLGGAVWMSGSAVPGDSLYGIKRASENFELSMLNGDTARGNDYLDLATTRAQEIKTLLSREDDTALGGRPSASGLSAHTTQLVLQALSDGDSETQAGSRLLTAEAARSHSSTALKDLTAWAPQQLQRLDAIAAQVPAGQVRQRVMASQHVTEQAGARATALTTTVTEPCQSQATTDAFGPVPTYACPTSGSSGLLPTTPGLLQTGSPSVSGATPTGSPTATGQDESGSSGTDGSGSSSGHQGLPSIPGLPLPTLPLNTLPSLPLPTDSCGLEITLPNLATLSLGPCKP